MITTFIRVIKHEDINDHDGIIFHIEMCNFDSTKIIIIIIITIIIIKVIIINAEIIWR